MEGKIHCILHVSQYKIYRSIIFCSITSCSVVKFVSSLLRNSEAHRLRGSEGRSGGDRRSEARSQSPDLVSDSQQNCSGRPPCSGSVRTGLMLAQGQ